MPLFNRREASEASRLVTSELPSPRKAPKAEPTFTAISGVISVSARPVILESVKSSLFHFSPQTIELETIAPSSTLLPGQILQFALTVAESPIVHSSETTTLSNSWTFCPSLELLQTIASVIFVSAPIFVFSQMILFLISAPAPISVLAPITLFSSLADSDICAPLPMNTFPLIEMFSGIFASLS